MFSILNIRKEQTLSIENVFQPMADFNFLEVLDELNRGIKAVITMPDGEVEYIETPQEFKDKFRDYTDYKYRIAGHVGSNMSFKIVKSSEPMDYTPIQQSYTDPMVSGMTKEVIDRRKMEFVLNVAVGLAAKKGLTGAQIDAVKGYATSKFSFVDNKFTAAYDSNWTRFLDTDNELKNRMIVNLKNYLNEGIDRIASLYQMGVLEKATYLNPNAGMTHMLNTNYTPVVQDEDAMIDTGVDAEVNPDPYRVEFNRLNDQKTKRKAPEGLYEESNTQQKLR